MFVIGWFAEQSLCHGSYTHKITTLTASLGTAFNVFFSQISQLFFSGYLLRGEKSSSLFFSTVNHSCPDDQFKCQNNRCIPKRWLCDGANDCGNNEDESNKTCAGKNFTWLCKQIL